MFLIRERHPGIDLSGIDFLSLRGAAIPDKDDGEEEEVTMDDQFGAWDEIQTVSPNNPSAEIILTVAGTIPSMSETTAVVAEAISMGLPEANLFVSGLPIEEAVFDVLILVEFVCNVLCSIRPRT